MGHELSGRIEEVGAGVTGLQVGDAIIVENNTSCGVCNARKNGESRYCRSIWTFMNDQAGVVDRLITYAFPLDEYRQAFKMADNPDERVGKVIMEL